MIINVKIMQRYQYVYESMKTTTKKCIYYVCIICAHVPSCITTLSLG